ncbi:MAG: helix-turn-helix transcriptional regulator [Bacteroidales bacterium]|nr:helix-turn-helix transcriptional regulator [Bacteroidales bacterium]MBR3528325.1 helix-turn-helix transcriptional regulator [Bacteroidales bacterium]MBR3987563.1 helix-turn-helix transcriptional regulator [Bacteroidales bacterium]MBR6990782.1 helix-turn-helix transcriptional regulator [Bacteroidales bacterium]
MSHKVKELCKNKGITIKELAEKMDIAPESLSRAINGNPQLSTIRKIAETLGVSVTDLFDSSEDELLAIVVCAGETHTATTKVELKKIVDAL